MTHLTYLFALLLPLAATAAVDRRWRLVLWAHPLRGVAVLAVGTAAFLGWDLVALAHGFYRRGGSPLTTGLDVVPDLPLEEVFFVLFLCYFTLVLHRLVHGLLARRPARDDRGHVAEVQDAREEVRPR